MSALDWKTRQERAKRRAAVRSVPFPGPWPNRGKSWCVWCGERIIVEAGKKGAGSPNLRAQWHPSCVHAYYLHSRLETQFTYVADRDGLRCAWPGCGATPERWHSNRIDVISCEAPPMPWTGRRSGDAYWRALCLFRAEYRVMYWDIERRTALQLDHRIPLWSVEGLSGDERRPFFGPDNLWLLCPEHHKAKTAREAADRATLRRAA